ncbi:Oxo-4-hydroxy-4-carboxy-5-ureidoimidazoline decarboxylase [Exophiala viscosa]|uniref:Oxo-4-hydroxy-4-carboxy-5-ureidoimidazoline decarboxylase n=1 Tax=Exophiala viscosa TaxID=2486360 RepID=UPI00219713E4|nr:Oxo-4-hydroxy-4-carboxy-5-ureidoimidazoline decarboxylase [Exophiala viscosa]
MATLPPISTLPSLDTEERAKVLDLLFEPCQQLHTLSVSSLREKTFSSYDEVIDAVGKQLFDLYESNLESDTRWLDAILSAHPRLGEKKVDSEQSRKEQAQLNQGGSEEAQLLADMNRKYEETFPGLRYVVFVNGRSRPVIMADMQKRIERADINQEKEDSIKAMCAIASDRAQKLGG